MSTSGDKKLQDLIMQELCDIKEHQESVKDEPYFSAIEIDYLHFVDMFMKDYSKEEIMSTLNEMYQSGQFIAIRNPQGLLFDIKLK